MTDKPSMGNADGTVGPKLWYLRGRPSERAIPRSSTVELRPSEDPDRLVPADLNVNVWRYMDLAKYLHLLSSQKLFFARADYIAAQDPFEGSLPRLDKETTSREYNKLLSSTPELRSEYAEMRVFEQDQFRYQFPRDTFLSCWHASPFESAAMWHIYGRTDRSVAVQTTFEKLRLSLVGKAALGMIQYIDYDTESMFTGKTLGAMPFLFKRISFEYEHELRCIVQRLRDRSTAPHYDDSEKGIEVEVSLPNLVQSVFVSPDSESWYVRLLKDLTIKLGFHFEVRQSRLDSAPIF
jgi:hypothetical protein